MEDRSGRKQFAAAAKSLQSCPTLCDPIDGSPSGSPVPGILQARTLEWVAISFSNAWKWKVNSCSNISPLMSLPGPTSMPQLKNYSFKKKKKKREKRNCSAQACSAQVLHKLGNFKNKISEMLYLQYSEHLSLLMLAPGWLSGHTGKWPDLGRLKPQKRWVPLV